MRRGLLPLAAALLLLPGCHQFWGSSSSSSSGSTTVYGPTDDASAAEATVRASIPAVEAYYADHGSYAGMTPEGLRTEYDRSIGDIVVVAAQKTAYCVESTVGTATASYRGPAGPLAPVGCDEAPPPQSAEPPPPPSYDAETNVRAAIPAIEAYYADNGSYRGATAARLRATYDMGLPDVKIVVARKNTYCVESSVGGEIYSKRGPQADIVAGGC
jgi:hypothetical protein